MPFSITALLTGATAESNGTNLAPAPSRKRKRDWDIGKLAPPTKIARYTPAERADFFNAYFRRNSKKFANVSVEARAGMGCVLRTTRAVHEGRTVCRDVPLFRGAYAPNQYCCDSCARVHEVPFGRAPRGQAKGKKNQPHPFCDYFEKFVFWFGDAMKFVASCERYTATRFKFVLQNLFARRGAANRRAAEKWSLVEHLHYDTEMKTKKGNKFPKKLRKLMPDYFLMSEEYIAWLLGIYDTNSIEEWDDKRGETVYLITSLLQHSCLPNTDLQNVDATQIDIVMGDQDAVAMEYIPAGRALSIAYFGDDDFDSRNERRSFLKASWGFDCRCRRCGDVPVAGDGDQTNKKKNTTGDAAPKKCKKQRRNSTKASN